MKPITFPYGRTTVDVEISGAKSVEYLREKQSEEIADIHAAFLRAITEECVESPPLHEILSRDDPVTIVISDITRFWMRQDLILKELVEYLRETVGIPYENMVVLVAVGTHRLQTEAELRQIASEEVYHKVKVYNHDCMATDLAYVGETPRGTQVYVNPLAVGRKVILIGGTVYHIMPGLGGGRKSILPGICGKSTINQNHMHSLDPKRPHSNPAIGMGVLEGNPVHEDMMDACALVAPAFAINLLCSGNAKHIGIIAGHWHYSWEESCRLAKECFGVPIAKKADIVVGSCGGFPRDLNLYQAVKTLFNMAQAVKEGGTLVFLAQCGEGGGTPDFFNWSESLKTDSLDEDLRGTFTIGGYIFYASCEVMQKVRVLMLTEIQPEILTDMGITAFSRIEDLLGQVDFTDKDVYVMQSGGSTVPYLA